MALGIAAATGQQFEGKAIKSDGARVALDAIKWAVGRMQPNSGPVVRVRHSVEGMTDAELDEQLRGFGAQIASGHDGDPQPD